MASVFKHKSKELMEKLFNEQQKVAADRIGSFRV